MKPKPEPLPPNTRFGHYEIVAPLGTGGMGIVYRAKDTRLGREVALKLLSTEAAGNSDLRRRFEAEARTASALNHPNIVTIFDVGSDAGRHFIVSELVPGHPLRKTIKEEPVTVGKLLNLAVQIADGLAAAHEAGIIHRDLKPDNIMITPDGRVKILDFGLAKLLPSLPTGEDADSAVATLHQAEEDTTPGVIMGTVKYMSPEQAQGDKLGFQTDQFSLGLILYELATGKHPFVRPNSIQTLAAIMSDPLPPFDAEADYLPERFKKLIEKCLSKSARDRFARTRDLLDELHAVRDALGGDRSSSASGSRLSRATPLPKEAVTNVNSGPDTDSDTVRIPARHIWTIVFVPAVLLTLAVVLFPFLRSKTVPPPQNPSAASRRINSVAVLPFVNAGSDANGEYLSDGITEALINNLSQLPDLRVMARSTVFRYKGRTVDPLQVGKDLKVRAVLTGRVQQRGDTLLISTELVDTSDGALLWGEQYNRKASDIFALQDDISEEISEKLRLRLTGEQRKQLTKRFTENPDALHAYLKGRYAWNQRTKESLENAIIYFRQAIEVDPKFAPAYAGLADAYSLQGYYGIRLPKEAYADAKISAVRALELDPTVAEAHTALADIMMYYDWDFAGAEKQFRRALELNPGYATARQWLALCLTVLGRPEESFEEARKAQELDPLSLPVNTTLAHMYYYAGRHDDTIAECRKTLALGDFVNTHAFLGLAYEQKKMYAEAIVEFQKARTLSDDNPAIVGMEARARALAGQKAEAQKLLDELVKRGKTQYVPSFCLALVHSALGENDKAFALLEKGYAERYREMVFLKTEPRADSLRSDPRFRELLRKIGLEK